MSLDIRLKKPTPDEHADNAAVTAIALCQTCASLMPVGYPLWGLHLQAAATLHAAHRAVSELATIPGLTDDDRRFGKRYGLVEDKP